MFLFTLNSVFMCIPIDILFCRNLQLKSSLLLHIDGTSPVAEDIGRQVGFPCQYLK